MQEFTHLKKSSIYKVVKLIKDGNEDQLCSKKLLASKLKKATLLNKYKGLVEYLFETYPLSTSKALKIEFERHTSDRVSKRTILRWRHYLGFAPAPVVPKLVLNEAQRNVRLSYAEMPMDEPNFDCWWFSR